MNILLSGKFTRVPVTSFAPLCHPSQALGTIYELLYTKEYRNTVCWAFSGILLGLLTELYYLLEVGLVQGLFDYQEDDLGSKPLGPCR